MLNDLNGYADLAAQMTPIKLDIETFENQLYTNWLGQVMESIGNKELT